MLNKSHKIINNKFSILYKFVFFLRYIFLIFSLAILIFLYIPKFFDYNKREKTIKNSLQQSYGLEIKSMEKLSYNFFPVPHLQGKNLTINFYSENNNLSSEKIIIYPNLLSIYNHKNFQARKIKLENNNLNLNLKNIKDFGINFFNKEKKIFLKNLNLNLKDNNLTVLNLEKIDFLNYGYKKNKVVGKVFDKNFKIIYSENLKEINFNFQDAGIRAKLNIFEIDKNSKFKGSLKGKVLKSNFKFNILYDENSLKIIDLYLRNKDLSLDSEGIVNIRPFFKISLNSEIKNINTDILRNLNINNIIKFKKYIKKINSDIVISSPKKFNIGIVDDLIIRSNLAYGRLNFSKNFVIASSKIACDNNINLLEEYPILFFHCSIKSPDKKKLFKKIKIKHRINSSALDLDVKGNLNILNKKINFDYIKANNDYIATKEDLKYFKNKFENILYDKNFIGIFELSKIRKFISEIS